MYRAIRALAGIPKTPRQAVALVALFSMLTSLISWGLSLIFSGLFVRELAHRIKGLDYRAAGAAAYLGLGAVWAMGLSSSAAMLMATKSAMPPTLFNISGLIPLTQTLFLWQSIATTAILIVLSVLIAYLSTPVSYTHLDVYKRQIPSSAKISGSGNHRSLQLARPRPKRTRRCSVAVSYTHLDVYKRQSSIACGDCTRERSFSWTSSLK